MSEEPQNLIISTSLSPRSRSRIVAKYAASLLDDADVPYELIDLRDHALPFCDADQCYSSEVANALKSKIEQAPGILLATPIYNYNIGSSAKNLIELTGAAWTGKVAGFICAAGGRSSYMTIMTLANSLMLDFRTWIVPRFVYVTGEHFEGNDLTDEDVRLRVSRLLEDWQKAIHGIAPTTPRHGDD